METCCRRTLILVIVSVIIVSAISNSPRAFAQSEEWSAPISLSNSAVLHDTAPSIAVDYTGNVHVVWWDANNILFHSKYNGTVWSSPVMLNEGNKAVTGPDSIAVDNLGRLHLVYTDASTGLLNHRLFNGDTWSDAVPIAEEFQLSGPPFGVIQWPAVAIDSQNNQLHVVWPQLRDDGEQGFWWVIYHSIWDGFGWSEPQAVTSTDYFAYQPQIAVDNTGAIHIVWLDNTSRAVYYQNRDGISWTEPIALSTAGTPAGEPDIAVNSAGNIFVVWTYATVGADIYYTRGPDWSAPINISNIPFNDLSPSLAIDTEDNLHLVWAALYGGSTEILYKRWDGVSWSPEPTNISQNSTDSVAPNIAVDDNSGLHVVWKNSRPDFVWDVLYSTTRSAPAPSVSESDYRLPYSPGIAPLIYTTQGNDKTCAGCSHNGKDSKAFDFAQERVGDGNTQFPILAARSGRVFDFREDQLDGCAKVNCPNYIIIVHEPDDGTADIYLHLKTNSVIPSVGDWVSRGCQIATTDNTGKSTGDHLHFAKQKKPDKQGWPHVYTQSFLITSGTTPFGFGDVPGGIPQHTAPLTAYQSNNIPAGPCVVAAAANTEDLIVDEIYMPLAAK